MINKLLHLEKNMSENLCIALAQVNFLVGAVAQNTQKVLALAQQARDTLKADIIVFPELTLTGYPPEDLLFRPGLKTQITAALKQLCEQIKGITVVLGYPEYTHQGHIYNAAAVIAEGKILAHYRKQELPNYGVFDEKRYFLSSDKPCVFTCKNTSIAVTICEDLWFPTVLAQAKTAGAQLALCLNASPFDNKKQPLRAEVIKTRVLETGLPVLYVNWVCGQDELVFDGGSFAMDEQGTICCAAPHFKEMLLPVKITTKPQLHLIPQTLPKPQTEEALLYEALVLGVRDYVTKNGFKGALLGLSGGIDSALTLTIAVDALGADQVEAILMPSRFTAQMSIDDAIAEADLLKVKHRIISIEPTFQTFLSTLNPEFSDRKPDTTEENIQARCRGIILMALSNKFGSIVLTTGNKSEMAVGYATLYGDMAGGFAVLKDVPKTWVYRLAEYRNTLSPVIPERVITRPPSAELAADQTDQDSLPPYPILDQIIERFVEQDEEIETIVAAGFDEKMVTKVVKMIRHNEYKRRQAPPGIRITVRAFGRDRRYPITSGYQLT